MFRPRSLFIFGILCFFALPRFGDAEEPQTGVAPTTVLAPTQLRGYGTLKGRYWRLAVSSAASLLEIQCDDADKARITQAKYFSDLACLPGVTKFVLPSGVAAREISGQGAVVALRDGTRLFILSVGNRDELAPLLSRVFPSGAENLVSNAEVDVPMFLDRWDRFGFRFYYRPWELPPGGDRKKYDFANEFAWAAQQQRSGLVFWDEQNQVETAEGMMNEAWWDWAELAAGAKRLPVAINLSAEAGGASVWLLNRYREQTQQRMPQYCGDFAGVALQNRGGHGSISWNAQGLEDVELGLLQSSVHRFVDQPNVVSWMEPHGELDHGPQDIFMDYGPVADATWRRYLAEQYQTLSALSSRWFGNPTHLQKWDEVHVPELASFLGWGSEAIDLSGEWRVAYEPGVQGKQYSQRDLQVLGENPVPTDPAPADWFSPEFDDRAWPAVTAPGHDRTLFLPKRPAVYRRTVDVPSAWKAAHSRSWIYVWDLNRTWGSPVQVFLNGRKVGESAPQHPNPHWTAFEVSEVLRAGANQISLRLPQGYLAYRVYFSPDPPAQYPNLSPALNAQWVDFCGWTRWSRVETCRRGVEMIRQVDRDRQVTFAHPDEYADGIKQLAQNYGGEFHNTGYMGAFYADYAPLLMQGAGLPFSVEPGGPPETLESYKHMMGLYFSEGVQGLDYFIHIGDVLWHDDIRREFEATSQLVHFIGKYHAPKADVAVLYSTAATTLTGFPWGNDPNVNLEGGYWNDNVAAHLRDRFAHDGITESDFASGNAAKYRVIIDSNTSILNEALVAQIEHYVREGGTFVTFAQTGRHTPEQKDAWPISRLTGYETTRITRYTPDGQVPASEWHPVQPAPGQTIFRPENWKVTQRANGLFLKKTAPDCQDLLLWDDGSTAVGMRPLGKGYIVEVGAKFTPATLFARIEPGGNTPDRQATTVLLATLLEWQHVAPIPARLSNDGAPDGPVILRHWQTNNGLYDVWMLWNQNAKAAVTTDVIFQGDLNPKECFEVASGETVPLVGEVTNRRLANVGLQPLQTRAFLTPRGALELASLDWLELQRSWWRGSKAPSAIPLPSPPHLHSLDLSADWAWKPLLEAPNGQETAALADPTWDDSTWERMRLGIWSLPDRQNLKHAMFRRHFTVPADWSGGRTTLWLQSSFNTTFIEEGNIRLDGKLVHHWVESGLAGIEDDALKAGTSHVLAVEIDGEGALEGTRGTCWLWNEPAPNATLDLAGDWSPSLDVLHYGAPIQIPGDYTALSLRRTVTVPAELSGNTTMIDVTTNGSLFGVLINGRWIRRYHLNIGSHWSLNITPYIHFGAENEIEIVSRDSPSTGKVESVRLDFYKPEVFP
ncbi:MAG: beta-galactosidase [Chthoniobacter sp.]|nr:beta-galactosidase [Chthoniobacter sp.]